MRIKVLCRALRTNRQDFHLFMYILIISNLYPNQVEKNKGLFNRRQFFEFSSQCTLRIIAQVAWTNRLFLKLSGKGTIPYRETIDGIAVYHPTYFFTPKIFSLLYGFFCFMSIYFTAARLIRSTRPDCILATWAFPDGFAAVMLGRLYNVPVFIKVHGSDIHGIGSGFARRLTAWTLKKARKVFSVNRDLGQRMFHMGLEIDRIVTIYNGIDRHRFFPRNQTEIRKEMGVPLEANVLLYVGNLVEVKGLDVLIDAFNILKVDSHSLILYVLGSGSFLKTLQAKCRLYGIEKSVVFTDSVRHEEINCWMNLADFLVVPSRNEGVPNVILEAMACGVPVVATRVGGIPEVVVENETGLLVESDNPSELAEAIGRAFEKKWNSKVIISRSKKFTWKENASLFINCIKREIEF